FRVRLGLTPLAAAGLLVIMLGAVVVSVITQGVSAAAFPLVVGVLVAFVAGGRKGLSLRSACGGRTHGFSLYHPCRGATGCSSASAHRRHRPVRGQDTEGRNRRLHGRP